MTRDAKYSVIAFLGGAAVMGLLVFLSLRFEEVDWVKWFGFALCTGLVFGIVAYKYWENFSSTKCLALFLAMLAFHLVIVIRYLRSVETFPRGFFLFSPFEGAALAAVLGFVGGARIHRRNRTQQLGHDDNDRGKRR